MLVLIAGATAIAILVPGAREWLPVRTPSPGYTVGGTIDLPTEQYRDSAITIVAFSRSTCPGCEAAKPYLARLAARVAGRSDARMLVVTPMPLTAEEYAFNEAIGVSRQNTLRMRPGEVRAYVTPTVLVVDRSGTILFARQGPLGVDDELAVRRLLDSHLK